MELIDTSILDKVADPILGHWINKVTSCAIVGQRDSGKTSLAFDLLRHSTKPVFVYGHPKPKLMKLLGYNILYRLGQIEKIHDSTLWIDEPQLHIPQYDKRANDGLQKLLSIALHRNITLLLSSCDTRFFTRGLESYIDVWIVKNIDTELVKQGSLIKKIIRRNSQIDPDGFDLDVNEYILYSRVKGLEELNELHKFDNPNIDKNILKAYK